MRLNHILEPNSGKSTHQGNSIWESCRRHVQTIGAGPTVVVDQQHCSSAQQKETPRRSLLVYPRRNNFLLFDSRLGHGVLDTLSGDLRMTLLINWWHHKPMVSLLLTVIMSACVDCGMAATYEHHLAVSRCKHDSLTYV